MKRIRDFTAMVYYELMQMNLKNGEVRKKFDSIKYDLKKLEEALLQAKLSGRL
jgi:predicted translin family RNA/ssDNA-binding protein